MYIAAVMRNLMELSQSVNAHRTMLGEEYVSCLLLDRCHTIGPRSQQLALGLSQHSITLDGGLLFVYIGGDGTGPVPYRARPASLTSIGSKIPLHANDNGTAKTREEAHQTTATNTSSHLRSGRQRRVTGIRGGRGGSASITSQG